MILLTGNAQGSIMAPDGMPSLSESPLQVAPYVIRILLIARADPSTGTASRRSPELLSYTRHQSIYPFTLPAPFSKSQLSISCHCGRHYGCVLGDFSFLRCNLPVHPGAKAVDFGTEWSLRKHCFALDDFQFD